MNKSRHAPGKLESVSCNLCGNGNFKEIGIFNGIKIVRCRGCGLTYRNPRLKEEPTRRLYSVDYYNQYGGITEDISNARKELFKNILTTLDKKMNYRPRRLLDIGCGQGHFLKMAKDAGWDATGVELARSACDYAKEKFNLDVMHAGVEEVRFEENSFGAVTLWNVLDHLRNPSRVLKETGRILKPGGLLVIRVPNARFHLFAHRVFLLFSFRLKRARFSDPSVVANYGFNDNTIRKMLKKAGFRKINVSNSPPTLGDPYKSFSKFSSKFVNHVKNAYNAFSCLVFYLSFESLIIGSSLLVYAKKEKV